MTNKEMYREICRTRYIPVFGQDWWLDIMCRNWDAAIAHQGQVLTGAWAYSLENKLGISLIRSPQLTPYGGPSVFYPPDLRKNREDNFEYDTVCKLLKQIPKARVFDLFLCPGQKQTGLFKQYGFSIGLKQTFTIDLEEEETNLLLNMHEETRRNVSRGAAEFSISNEPMALPVLYEYHKATLKRKHKKVHFSYRKLEELFVACRERDCCGLWVARKGGKIQAIIWNVWDEHTSYYMAGARNPEVIEKRAMAALLWHSIRYGKMLNKKVFDFEGSSLPGVERFFRNFGGRRELCLILKKNNSLRWKAIGLLKRCKPFC